MKTLLFLFIVLNVINLQFCTENKQDSEEDEPFVPTREWQVVKKGQKIPEGLHVRVNFQTGVTEAKLLDHAEDEKGQALAKVPGGKEPSEDDVSTANMNLKKNIEDALKKIKSDDRFDSEYVRKMNEKFRNYEEIKKDLGELDLFPKTDAEVLGELIRKHQKLQKGKQRDDADVLMILEDIEFLVHQYDNAIEFIRLNGYREVIYKNLNSSNIEIKKEALKIFGSALQNNVKLQIHVLESGGLDILLRILALDNDYSVKVKALFALSGFLRRFPLAQLKFIENAGLSVFSKLYNSDNIKLQLKLVTLIHDMLSEHIEALKDDTHIHHKEKVKQYKQVNLRGHLFQYNFCEFLDKLLVNVVTIDEKDFDSIEKCVNLVSLVVDECGQKFSKDFSEVLLKLLNQLKSLLDDEKKKGDDYFYHLHHSVLSTVKSVWLKQKTEL